MLNKQFAFDRPLQDKGRINRDVKHAIACAAAALIEDGDAVILDSGSTTSQMAPQLAGKKDLVVMTNALNIAFELANNEQIDLMVVGGSVRRKAGRCTAPPPNSSCASTGSTSCFSASTVSIWRAASPRRIRAKRS